MSKCIDIVPHNSRLLGITYQEPPLSFFARFYYSSSEGGLILFLSVLVCEGQKYCSKLILSSKSMGLCEEVFKSLRARFIINTTESLQHPVFEDLMGFWTSRGYSIFYHHNSYSFSQSQKNLRFSLGKLFFPERMGFEPMVRFNTLL